MVSWKDDMIRSKDRIYVLCVTKSLHVNRIWFITAKGMLRQMCIRAHNVRKSFLISIAYVRIWMVTAVNTSALNVESVARKRLHSKHTDEFIREKTFWMFRLWKKVYAGCCTNCTQQNSQWTETLQLCHVWPKVFYQSSSLKAHMTVHTGEKPQKCPKCLKVFRWRSHLSTHVRVHAGVKPYINVHFVTTDTDALTTYRNISVVHTATKDRIIVFSVERRLRLTLIESVIFVFILVIDVLNVKLFLINVNKRVYNQI